MLKYFPLVLLGILAMLRIGFWYKVPERSVPASRARESKIHIKVLENMTNYTELGLNNILPSPHAQLVLGMTLGKDSIKDDTLFNSYLINAGLIHIVVVSGYNISLLLGMLDKIALLKIYKHKNVIYLCVLCIYALICNLEPPVIRASIMGYIGHLALTYGRAISCLSVLLVSCLVMLIVNPTYITSLSFWLSSLATFGLITVSPLVEKMLKFLPNVQIFADLKTTLSCQIVVWPLISFFFGRINLISPIYNMLLLWLVPISTILGCILVVFTLLAPVWSIPALLASIVVYPFVDLFTRGVYVFGRIPYGQINYNISLSFMVLYYLILLICVYKLWPKS